MTEDSNEIERYFHSHLGENEIPFEENDWRAMEEKLNTFDSLADQRQSITGKYIAIIALAILLFMAGWFSRDIFSSQERSVEQNQIEIIAPPPAAQDEMQDGTLSPREPSDEQFLTDNQRKEEAITPSSSKNSQQKDLATALPPSKDNHLIPDYKTSSSIPDPSSFVSQSELKPSSDYNKMDKGYVNPERDVNGNGENIGRILKIKPLVKTILPVRKEVTRIENKEEDEQETSGKQSPGRWSVGINFAPDFNGVGAIENYKIAWEVGIVGLYSFHPRWRLSTGILYAKKSYEASGDDYSPPEGYWDDASYGIIPERIEAQCGIIDIPLNITYLWNPHSRFRLTSTAGISNYIILNEDYVYDYGDNTPYHAYKQWSTDKNSTAFFGMINMAIGVEWQFRPGLDLSVEPYLKVPVKEIGFGNVPLTGTGVFFTIRKNL